MEKKALFFFLALFLLMIFPAFSACPDNPPINHRICRPVSQGVPAGNWEEANFECSANDRCCDPDGGVWCLVEMKNTTDLCKDSSDKFRRCDSAKYPGGGTGWAVDTSLSCNSGSTCCPNNRKCYAKDKPPPNPSEGVTVRLSPVAPSNGNLKTYCQARVRVVQDNSLPCFSNATLKVRLGGTDASVTKRLDSFDYNATTKKCIWVWNVTGIETQGHYNFSFYNATMHIRSNATGAYDSSQVSCTPIISNCTAFCNLNSSVPAAFAGCGLSPCGPTQGKFTKNCLYNCPQYSFCSAVSECVPKVNAGATVFNLTPWNFSVRLSANISGYSGLPPETVEFFLDNKSAGTDRWIPYSIEVPVLPRANHSFFARAKFPFGTFSSNISSFSVGERAKITPYLSCDSNCPSKDRTNCTCSVSHCLRLGNVSVRPLRSPENTEYVMTSDSSFSFYPDLDGNHSVSVDCLESEIGETPLYAVVNVPKNPYYFTLLPASTCGIPDNSSCSIALYSNAALPSEFVILGAGSEGTVFSEAISSPGWKGENFVNFTRISYSGKGPYSLYLLAYPKGALLSNPGNFVYSRFLFSID